MLLSAIKEQLQYAKSEITLEPPKDTKYSASHQMRINDAKVRAEKLTIDYSEVLLKTTHVTLVHAPRFEAEFSNPLIFNHKDFAKQLSSAALPSLRMGTQMSAYQISPMNNKLDEICLDLGVNTQFSPRLNMDLDQARIIDTAEQLTSVTETLVQKQLKNMDTDDEGHTFQVLYVQKELSDRSTQVDLPDGRIDIIVFVPHLSRSLVSEYNKRFKNVVKTVSFTEKTADVNLTSSSDLTVLLTELTDKSVTKSSVKTNVKKKKV